ncbi:MAG: histone H1 [Ignavibacteria bacterium]|jgi:peptidoglycan hydrolase CwlO-like protein|nr:histone H1 [Ignavibacteria bacterium]MBS1491977.1 histone H1 [Bacteroidota bacterium]
MEKFSDLQKKLDDMKTDIEKFYSKGQNAAGTRLRKSLNELKKVASDIRKEIQDTRASRKTEG